MNFKYTNKDLEVLESRYKLMHDLHSRVHENLIEEINVPKEWSVLEVACGIALNHDYFISGGAKYYGLDISETAIAVALLTYPESCFFNIGVDELSRLGEKSFDIIYSSSMLEHIGFYEEAIRLMCRAAARKVYIVFFEGLKSDGESDIKFNSWEESYISKEEYVQSFGVKNADQDHRKTSEKGWYWNRYSISDMEKILKKIGIERWDYINRSNREWCKEETILVIDLD